jgi:hypothetical protein
MCFKENGGVRNRLLFKENKEGGNRCLKKTGGVRILFFV